MLRPGDVIADEFEIQSPLSEGGMGSIYVVHQRSTDTLRALKVMLPQWLEYPELARRFEQEAKASGKIESEHVVKVLQYGVDRERGIPWLVMELLRGETLEGLVAREGPPALQRVDAIMDQLFHGLSAAHDAGVVHRDLKPSNVFMTPSQRADALFTLKILDFGIAKILSSDRPGTKAMGTRAWMAPEQERSGSVVRQSTDVWAIGLLAFWLCTGHQFWLSAEAEPSALVYEVFYAEIPLASERAHHFGKAHLLPPGFDAWFARCVARSPDDRFASARRSWDAWRSLQSNATSAASNMASPPSTSAPPLGTSLRPQHRSTTAPITSDGPPGSDQRGSLPRGASPPATAGTRVLPLAAATVALLTFAAVTWWKLGTGPSSVAVTIPSTTTVTTLNPTSVAEPTNMSVTSAPDDAASADLPRTDQPLRLSGQVSAGFTNDNTKWTTAFEYRSPEAVRSGLNFLQARDSCHDTGLGLCSEAQWERLCQGNATAEATEVWTTSYLPNGQVWVRGGGSCDKRRAVPVEERLRERGVVCCTRVPTIITRGNLSAATAKAATGYVLDLQRTMNLRDPHQVISRTHEQFKLYNSKRLVTQPDALRSLGFDLKNATEWDTHLISCSPDFRAAGQEASFECDTVMVRKATRIPDREVAFLTTFFNFHEPDHKYDQWAVGRRFARRYAAVE